MRESKFRGKCKDNGEWIYGFYGKKEATNQRLIMVETLHQEPTYGSYFTDYEVDPGTVGQYCGFHDDDDQCEVYDGDILILTYAGEEHICEVKYEGCGLIFVAESLPDGYIWAAEVIEWDRKHCFAAGTKMLGNIHDNYYLLSREAAGPDGKTINPG